YLPLNGELVLASGAGFAAFDGSWDPGCDSGATVRFADAEHHSWFDPTLWQAVSPSGELEPGRRIFSVDEERVPCHYDDVIFQPETSFRVNVDSSQQVIHVRSISLMGQELSSPEAWAGYLRGPSAPLQFQGNGTLQVTGTGCPDKSGCACGNALDGHRICTALLRASGGQCPAPACRSPLQPLGHCCGVCGELGAQPYSSSLSRRLPQPLPLALQRKAGVRMAISKVHKAQTFLGVIPRSSTPHIQIVLIEDEAGAQTGTAAEQMAADIMEDVAQHGNDIVLFGRSPMGAPKGTAVQSFFLKLCPAFSHLPLEDAVFWLGELLRRVGCGWVMPRSLPRLPALRLPRPWDRAEDPVSPVPASDKGFDNPMFDMELPSADAAEEMPQEMAPKDHQVFYLNPLYDASETET
ncbi:AMNLS protein, partial [Fregetta grallaria]|nr:AMNLS protein [Fregetta grallaria]